MMKAATDLPKDKALDSQLALSLIGRDAPHDLIVNRDFVTRIGNLCDVAFIRKLNISFNPIRSLDGIDQLPQLKQLLAYACGVDKIECLKAISKIESIFLQQNKISKMGDTFSGMSKLQELRVDQNRLTKIEGLSSCVSLRKLDISFNNVENLTGLSGLQQLQELKASNNAIKSLLPLKSLPSIKDLDVSNNQLKSLDGLQQMPTLEYVRADHNMIAELKLFPMLGTTTKKGTSTTEASREKPADKKLVGAAAGSATSSGAGAGTGKNKEKGALADVAERSGPMLLELSVKGNRIRSVLGLEVYSHSLETLDLSGNNLASAEVSGLIQAVAPCRALAELRLHLNPVCDDDAAMDALVAELSASCPALRAIDGLAIVANSDARYGGKAPGSISSSSRGSTLPPGAYAAAMARQQGDGSSTTLASGSQFHTWNDDGTTVMDGGTSVGGDDTLKDEKDEFSDESDSDEGEKDSKNPPADPNAVETKRYPHNLMLKEMLTPEQIQEKEEEIRRGLRYCKDRLETAARTVFGFLEETAAVAEEPQAEFKARRLLTQSASGARVAAVLDEAESQSRKQSAAVMVAPPTVAAAGGATAGAGAGATPPGSATLLPERAVLKEKLVDRVRLAVSSSAACSSPSTGPAVVKSVSPRPVTAEDAAVNTATPASASTTAGPVPNNPLLTDEVLASFRMHREANVKEATNTSAQDSQLRPSAALAAAAEPDASALSPGSKSVAGSTSSHTVHSKAKASSSSSAASYHLAPPVQGSGLTRYGTKIKQSQQQQQIATGRSVDAKAEDPTMQSNISILRAAGSNVESLDLLNLRITKPVQHVYMTEWPEDTVAAAAQADAKGLYSEDEEGEDDEKMDEDGDDDDGDGDGLYQYEYHREREYADDTPLDAVMEEDEEEEVLAESKASPVARGPQEVFFQEVRTRPEDRFGRALAGVGGGGFDPRAVRRGTVGEVVSSTAGSGGSGGTGDEKVVEAEQAALLRRGHSAPTLETASLTPREAKGEAPPLSPALSVAYSVASLGNITAYPPRLHPSAATVVATGAGSISPRPMAPSASQPKMKFSIPQSARNALNGSTTSSTTAAGAASTSTSGAHGKRGREDKEHDETAAATKGVVDFAALEKGVLRATAAGVRLTRNPTLPLPSAASGPFSSPVAAAGRDYK